MTDESSIGEQLAEWGKVALVETRGRVSGRQSRAAVGFIEEPDGSLLIAAGTDYSDWVRNLRADARCAVTIGDRTAPFSALEIEGPERSKTLIELVLKYGTPAEKLGHGPVFRLTPAVR
jgi:deazaflavin-dependent oxidoreductase (nitroreductase family)